MPDIYTGTLDGIATKPANPVECTLRIGEHRLLLNEVLGRGVEIRFDGVIRCAACGNRTAKSYAGGYCYQCFKQLARCDLCVMSPDRCHFFEGTCREPEWGERFCMQPHVVYLANSGGAKVGITRADNVPGRWLQQGATQGMVVLTSQTRQQAGFVEAALAHYVGDKSDWRYQVRPPGSVDLVALSAALRAQARRRLEPVFERFGQALSWTPMDRVSCFDYPVIEYPRAPSRLVLERGAPQIGTLLGVVGPNLLFDHGVLNVLRLTSYHVKITVLDAGLPVRRKNQLELF